MQGRVAPFSFASRNVCSVVFHSQKGAVFQDQKDQTVALTLGLCPTQKTISPLDFSKEEQSSLISQ
jgi:hypothetical protein